MKKVLFVHDGPLYVNPEETRFYGIHYNNKLVERYLYFGDSVTFLMRSETIDETTASKYTEITREDFNFTAVPNFKSLRSRHNKAAAKEIVKKAVAEHDVIIIRFPSAIGVLAFYEARKLGKPILAEMVACVFDALWNYDWRGKILAVYKYLQYKVHLKRTTHTVYVTKKFLQNRYPSTAKSINCSNVVIEEVLEENLQKRISKIKETDLSKLTIATVGSLDVVYKGQADVLKAIKILKDQGFICYYKIVGQGTGNRLAALINKYGLNHQVQIVGPLKHNEVFDFLDSIDLYVHPSYQEGLPRAVIEAMSRACPILGSTTGGIPELIEPQYIFSTRDSNRIAQLIKSTTKEQLESQARYNFEASKDYIKSNLDQRRQEFYAEFKKEMNL
ncbi:glycosyltransferase family 4 protein [Flavobacterium aurantiibacter]|uniref:Glycosyl transferase family 1 domain-containing protein n=1 Tax=Flavobacterium aurantiibacter TaxID=2023067 RepID=A0A255ZR27_9FLAO|nr:glycosyltransferase family 4 protein [Flavobacterium aurantiibacter]OYQ43948.1 hypothetical protein CHX27_08235 [Flavobacterium aurantiibacter]